MSAKYLISADYPSGFFGFLGKAGLAEGMVPA
jgi:hypothetical protein